MITAGIQLNVSKIFALRIWMLLLVSTASVAQTPNPVNYGCYPSSGSTTTFSSSCINDKAYEEIRIGQGMAVGFNNEPKLDIVIPANREEWAIAIYHYYLMTRNYLGKPIDINFLMSLGMKETVLTCDPSVVYPSSINGFTISYAPMQTAEAYWATQPMTIQDGCFQTDPSGLATLNSGPGSMPWRWGKTGTIVTNTAHAGVPLNGSAYIDSRYAGKNNFIYGMIANAQYMIQTVLRLKNDKGVDIAQLSRTAADPYAMEMILSRAYNKGQWDNWNTIFTNSTTISLWQSKSSVHTYYFGPSGVIETNYDYTRLIENSLYVLNNKTPKVGGQFYDWYDKMMDWNTFKNYIEILTSPQPAVSNPGNMVPGGIIPAFYDGIDQTALETNVKAVFDEAVIYSASRRGVAPDGKISFRYDAKPVIEAIVFGLPVDNPPISCTGCSGVATTIAFTGSPDICASSGETLNLTASPQQAGYTYQWFKDGVAVSNADGGWNPVYSINQSGYYELEITNSGCTTRTPCGVQVTIRNTCQSLPVEFISFTGSKHQSKSLLDWMVIESPEVYLYKVQKSLDGIHFTEVASIYKNSGIVNGNGAVHYEFEESNVRGLVYYRIAEDDYNGIRSYSPTITLSDESDSDVLLFPNPFDNSFQIFLSEPVKLKEVEIYNLEGIVIETITSVSNPLKLGENLAPGMYIVKVSESDQIKFFKVVKR